MFTTRRSFSVGRFPAVSLPVALAVTLILVVSATAQPASSPAQQTSETDDRLKQALQRFPQADLNKDGVLTVTEAKEFVEARRAAADRKRQQRPGKEKRRPTPTFANVRYGPHERNVFDVWLPDETSSENAPAVFVYFHGGGFVAGDKSGFDPTPYLKRGYAVMSGNYRFVNGDDVVTPAPMQDCTRALQYLRYRASDFGIDPTRIAVSGGSAGAVITMWIAYKDDMADPSSDDPVERQSTRVTCIVPKAGPTVLDPAWILKNVGGDEAVHSSMPVFYGVDDGDYSSELVQRLIAESSAVSHATKDDPPSLLVYGGELNNVPLPKSASQGLVIHHPYFGKVLKDKLDSLGVECHFHYGRNRSGPSEVEFLKQHLSR
jgi:acetyl esterase/lipase